MTYRFIGSIVPYRLNPTRDDDIILALAAGRLGLVANAHPRKRFHIPLTEAHEKHPETPNKSAAGSHQLRSLSRPLRLPPPCFCRAPSSSPRRTPLGDHFRPHFPPPGGAACGSDEERRIPTVDFNVDLTQKLCGALLFPHIRRSSNPFSQVIARLSIKHPNLFGRNEKLDVLWDKGIDDFNILMAFRRPRPDWLSQQSFTIQHSVAPEIAVHGLPVDHFTRSGSGGVNLSRFSVGVDFNEPSTSHWGSKTSIKFEHVRPLNNEGHTINRDMDGFPITSSGRSYDNMIVLKQESQYAIANDDSFTKFNFQMEQGLPLLSKWLIFNRFKIVASKGFKLGPTFLVTSLTSGSIVGDMAPYQAFALGGIGSVRGYGEGAVGSGRSCLVANGEFTIPVGGLWSPAMVAESKSVAKVVGSLSPWLNLTNAGKANKSGTKELEGTIFMDCGTDLGSGRHVPGSPALRQGKPGFGVGLGYGVRFNSHLGQFRVDYAINAFQRKTLYFGINGVGS
ncbi:outer envelope protein of 80 kDa [Musa troglodytarum]|uniref:Outer envelope protein of 80 kDa n=1 Tax=Musa troglodytarum TaxID=320322 RepID=A0A9E7GDR6_9LILI|nr:outer envelope protein of 80 kDa [Musa troglodytarum]